MSYLRLSVPSLFLFFTLLPVGIRAQASFEFEQNVPVTINGKLLKMPWAGGLDAGQYNRMDVNSDGTEDLLIFDRTAGRLMIFIATEEGYVAKPSFAVFFPDDLEQWVLFRDYDCDGDQDIFTATLLGIKVYRNITPKGGRPEWELASNLLLTKGSSSAFNLKFNGTDLPAIVDVDNDGDLDILGFSSTGSTVEYHQSQAIELTGSCDTLAFQRVNSRWGDFSECGCRSVAFGQGSCETLRESHFSAKSLLLFDNDGDGDKDVLFGEEDCSEMLFLENEGNTEQEEFSDFTADFPSAETPAALRLFPAAYYEDVDNDGLKDLVLAPNFRNNPDLTIDYQHSSWFYKNTGTADQPVFEFQQDDFLQDQMVDLGEYAAPALADVDKDGDLDLLVGRTLKDQATLVFFENTGSKELAVFELKSDDYLNLSLLAAQRIQPQIADLDTDGQPDLILNVLNLYQSTQQVHYILGKQDGELLFEANDLTLLNLSLKLEDYPLFEDVDLDGTIDMILGEQTGKLSLWINPSNAFPPVFERSQDNFLSVTDASKRRRPILAINDMNQDGKKDLLLSDDSGYLKIFWNYQAEDPVRTEDLLWTEEENKPLFWGRSTAFAVGRLTSEEHPVLLAGTRQGGLHWLRNVAPELKRQPLKVEIYPNPGIEQLTIRVNKSAVCILFTVQGQKIFTKNIENRNDLIIIDAPYFSAGVYILRAFSEDGEEVAKRLVILK